MNSIYKHKPCISSMVVQLSQIPKTRTHFRYIKETTTIYLLVKPAASSRNVQYYSRFHAALSPQGRHALFGFTNLHDVKQTRADHAANIITVNVSDAKVIANNLNMPLVIELVSYCDLDDKSTVEEIYFWKSPK